MNNEVLVSIITPMYNAEVFIVEAIQSVLNQTYQNWEMIIVDNYSTDHSVKVVEAINDKRIKLIKLDYNSGGPARPRNIGVEKSKGKYIAFLDADDIWKPTKLDIQLDFMNKNNLNISSTSATNIDENSKSINKLNYLKNYLKKSRKYNLEALLQYKFIYTSSVILVKKIFQKFNEEEDCISVEDYYLWLQLLNNENIRFDFLHKELLMYRIVVNSASDRNIIGKQDAKSMYYSLKFIIDNNRYDLLKLLKNK
ncbi:glycosyltransferase family 2 protein [Sulfurimonas sp.]|uniref:glycosyltransferase family 2 protein n=1 Tax=Sulfurimonas sp. TaxID=2022749 RepID=UPI003569BE01